MIKSLCCVKFFIYYLVLLVHFEDASAGSKKFVFKTHDKISLITHALMLRATVKNSITTFHWSEPHWDFTYYLELYKDLRKKPFYVSKVKGGVKKIRLKKYSKKLYWKIVAVSRHGNRSKNHRIYLIPSGK